MPVFKWIWHSFTCFIVEIYNTCSYLSFLKLYEFYYLTFNIITIVNSPTVLIVHFGSQIWTKIHIFVLFSLLFLLSIFWLSYTFPGMSSSFTTIVYYPPCIVTNYEMLCAKGVNTNEVIMFIYTLQINIIYTTKSVNI